MCFNVLNAVVFWELASNACFQSPLQDIHYKGGNVMHLSGIPGGSNIGDTLMILSETVWPYYQRLDMYDKMEKSTGWPWGRKLL